MKSDTIKTYSRDRKREKVTRNPFDDLVEGQKYGATGFQSTAATGFNWEDQLRTTLKSNTFKIYQEPVFDARVCKSQKLRKYIQNDLPVRTRTATPVASSVQYQRVSKRPVRSPRISKIVHERISSDEEQDDESWESEVSDEDEGWETEESPGGSSSSPSTNTDTRHQSQNMDSDSTKEYSSIEATREAINQKLDRYCFPNIDMPAKVETSPSTLSDSEDSRSLDTNVRDQLNSTLLNESQAKNLQDLDELGMSPILDAGDSDSDGCTNTADKLADQSNGDDEHHNLRLKRNEITPAHKLVVINPRAPSKTLSRLEQEQMNITHDEGEIDDERSFPCAVKKNLSPMYNNVATELQRVLKKTSTPVRRPFDTSSPPIFSVDLSSVQSNSPSGLYLHFSREVNSEEIHVNTSSSPVPVQDDIARPHLQQSVSRVDASQFVKDLSNRQKVVSSTADSSQTNRSAERQSGLPDKKTKRKQISEEEAKRDKAVSVFSFDSSSDETKDTETVITGTKRKLRSESPSREKHASFIKSTPRKGKLPQFRQIVSYKEQNRAKVSKSSSNGSSPPSSKKSVTWGSEVHHEYDVESPVYCSPNYDRGTKFSKPTLCLIEASEDWWPPRKIDPEKLPRLSKGIQLHQEKECELDILCREW